MLNETRAFDGARPSLSRLKKQEVKPSKAKSLCFEFTSFYRLQASDIYENLNCLYTNVLNSEHLLQFYIKSAQYLTRLQGT